MDFQQLMTNAVVKQSKLDPADAVSNSKAMQESVVASMANQIDAGRGLTNVQVDAAGKADTLRMEAATATAQDANNVVAMWQSTYSATNSSVEAAKSHLQNAAEKTQRASELEASRPSVFAHPLQAISSAWQSSKLRDEVSAHEQTASKLAVDVNGLLQMSRVQIEDTMAANKLKTGALITERAAVLSQGIEQDRLRAEQQVAEAGIKDTAMGRLYENSKNSVAWLNDRLNRQQQDKMMSLQAKRLQLDLDNAALEAKDRAALEANVDNVADAIARARKPNGDITAADKVTARSAATALLKDDARAFANMSYIGQQFKEASDPSIAWASVMKNGTIAGLNLYGAYSGNQQMQAFGQDLLRQAVARNLDSSLREAHRLSESTKKYDMWVKDVKPAQMTQYNKLALETARNEVGNMPLGEYGSNLATARDFSTVGTNLVALGNANMVAQTYGYKLGSAENAALASPQLKAVMQEAQAKGGDKNGTAKGIEALVGYLQAAKVPNPYAVAAKIYSRQQQGAMRDESKEFAMIEQGGYEVPITAMLPTSGGVKYNIADPEGIKRLVLKQQNPETPSALAMLQAPFKGIAAASADINEGAAYWQAQSITSDDIMTALNSGKAERAARATKRKQSFNALMEHVGQQAIANPTPPMPTMPPLRPEFSPSDTVDLGQELQLNNPGMDAATYMQDSWTPVQNPNSPPPDRQPRTVQPRNIQPRTIQPRGSGVVADPTLDALDSGQQWWQK